MAEEFGVACWEKPSNLEGGYALSKSSHPIHSIRTTAFKETHFALRKSSLRRLASHSKITCAISCHSFRLLATCMSRQYLSGLVPAPQTPPKACRGLRVRQRSCPPRRLPHEISSPAQVMVQKNCLGRIWNYLRH